MNTDWLGNFCASLDLRSFAGINPSYSQFGEDMIILGLLQNEANRDSCGYYVEVGVNNQSAYSNTAMLHQYYGWHGININSDSEVIENYNLSRKSDVNICTQIGLKDRLDEILNDALPDNTSIGLMSVAIEEPDLSILKSNNWHIYRPDILAVEYNSPPTGRPQENPLNSFLSAQRYHLVSQCLSTSIFCKSELPPI